MDTTGAGATCIIDRDGIIVWASTEFKGLFAHRAAPVGLPFNQLFAGLADGCRHGAQLEDRDRAGRRRYFRAECLRESNARGDRVSDVVVLRDVTLTKLLGDLSRLATQAGTPRELFEKAFLLIKDSCGYLGLAGFITRDTSVSFTGDTSLSSTKDASVSFSGDTSVSVTHGNELELIASKGWTEKLKSLVRIVPVAPDAPAMSGRCAYHREQMVTSIEEYGLMKSVKDAIARIGGEFLVVTPLIDHDRLVGVLAVIHGRALTPDELEALQTICSQLAVSLNVRVREHELSRRAEDAALAADLLGHEMALHGAVVRAWAEDPGDEAARESALKAIALNDEAVLDVGDPDAPSLTGSALQLADAVDQAVEDARLFAGLYGRKIAVNVKLPDGGTAVGTLLRYALRNLLVNSAKHARSPSVEVTIRSSVDRSGARKIEVADNGPGVPEEMKSGVFRREGPAGRATGLYLTKRIVSRYGGRIWIEDRVPGSPGKGTRAVITLPPPAR